MSDDNEKQLLSAEQELAATETALAAKTNPAVFAKNNPTSAAAQSLEWKSPSFARYLGIASEPPKEATPQLLANINSTSNQVHSMMGLFFGTSAYMFGTLMQFSGQGTFFTSASMFGAGCYFTAMSQLRLVRGDAPEITQGETMASIMWWMASFRQFKEHRTLKWCGWSSWTGLALAGYYSLRALISFLQEPAVRQFPK